MALTQTQLEQVSANWWTKSTTAPLGAWGVAQDFGFITVAQTGTSQRLTPFFNYSTSATQCVKNVVNYLYSSYYNLTDQGVQVAVFQASTGTLNCYHLVVCTTNGLPLQFLRTSSDGLGNGHDLLLACGYLYPPATANTIATDLAPLGTIPSQWHGDSAWPTYSNGTFAGILSYMAALKTSINTELNATFTSGDYAWFDSSTADFGEPDDTIVNASQVINDIYGLNGRTKLDFQTLSLTYAPLFQTYYRNLCALWQHSRTSQLPYYTSH